MHLPPLLPIGSPITYKQMNSNSMIPFGTVILHEIEFNNRSGSKTIEILYTNSLSRVETWLVEHMENVVCFGLDTESKPNFIAGRTPEAPAVLQISTLSEALVFQMNACTEDLKRCSRNAPLLYNLLFPTASDALTESLLGSAPKRLAGMSITGDLIELEDIFGFKLDADPLIGAGKKKAKLIKSTRHPHLVEMQHWGIGALSEIGQRYCNLVKWKTNSIQMSRWDVYPLSRRCIVYAAMDAFAGAAIFDHFHKHPPMPSPRGPPPTTALPSQSQAENGAENQPTLKKYKGSHSMPCFYFGAPSGCWRGDSCQFAHNVDHESGR